MDKPANDQNYPVEPKWVFKSSLYSLFTMFWTAAIMAYPLATQLSSISSGPPNIIRWFMVGIIAFFVFVSPILGFIIIAWTRHNFHFSFDEQNLSLQQGIISRQSRQIPYGVIQNIIVRQDLLDRLFGISSLIIENAAQGGMLVVSSRGVRTSGSIGFAGNRVEIPGLTEQNTQTLKTLILKKITQNQSRELGI